MTHKLTVDELSELVYDNGRLAIEPVADGPRLGGDRVRVRNLANLLMNGAKRPLVVVGKGAAYSRCEGVLRAFIEKTNIPFLPTPMGKGLLPDAHPLDASPSRSTALASADLIILLGARLNWILHFGSPPKLPPGIRICKIDISPEELGRNLHIPSASSPSAVGEDLSIAGDCGEVLTQLLEELDSAGWEGLSPNSHSGYESQSPDWLRKLARARDLSIAKLTPKLYTPTPAGNKMTYHRSFHLLHQVIAEMVKQTHPSSDPTGGENSWADNLVFVSEGANTMDISRSLFPITQPRQRLDAGTDATMGVGLGYAIAAWCAYNLPPLPAPGAGRETPLLGSRPRKKVIAIEGDSAVGFSAMEIETMARYHMDIIVIVVNNGGVYRGIDYSPSSSSTPPRKPTWDEDPRRQALSLPTTALSYRTQYSTLGTALGAKGFEVWGVGDGTDAEGGVERELLTKMRDAWTWSEGVTDSGRGSRRRRGPVVVDMEIESGEGGELVFAWLGGENKAGGAKL